MKKTTSLKQLAANQQNAKKSTGPRTPAGRAVSKMNALKHGILSRQVLVRGSNIQESSRELTALHQRFWEELAPVGPVEEMLVDEIVTTHWRLRRALTAESGEIALSVDGGQHKRSRTPYPGFHWMEWEVMGDPICNMEDSALGNRLLKRLLGELRTAVEQEGELSETATQKFLQGFGGKPNCLTRELEAFRLELQANPKGLEPAALREQNKQEAMVLLNQKLRLIEWRKATCEARERIAEESYQAAAVLPLPEVLEKILRYETVLKRWLHRCMLQLERVQRRRQGESVPAPMSVEISERG